MLYCEFSYFCVNLRDKKNERRVSCFFPPDKISLLLCREPFRKSHEEMRAGAGKEKPAFIERVNQPLPQGGRPRRSAARGRFGSRHSRAPPWRHLARDKGWDRWRFLRPSSAPLE